MIVTSKNIFFWFIMTSSSMGRTCFLLQKEAAHPFETLVMKCGSVAVSNIGGKDLQKAHLKSREDKKKSLYVSRSSDG